LRSADRSAPRWLGYLLNGQLQGKLLSAYKISQAFPGTPYMKDNVCATRGLAIRLFQLTVALTPNFNYEWH
ncbi:MAG: hypothetical protein ABSH01_29130, partial [Terriglobia bacterium]